MPDLLDLIQERQEATLEAQISTTRQIMTGISVMFCIELSRPITEAYGAGLPASSSAELIE